MVNKKDVPRKLKVINLIGPPGSGKSTAAYALAAHLKKNGQSVELIHEYAKTLVWHNRGTELVDQLYVTARQQHQLYMLIGQVEVVVTDSPLMLGSMFMPESMKSSVGDEFRKVVRYHEDLYDNVYYLVKRVHPFIKEGRVHTEEYSDRVYEELKSQLTYEGKEFVEVDGDEDAPEQILEGLLGVGWLPERTPPVRLEV